MSQGCAVEGSIRLDQDSGRNIDSKMYYLLQVCLFEQWSYVCSSQFDNDDLSVALHQIGSTHGYYTGGGNYKGHSLSACMHAARVIIIFDS